MAFNLLADVIAGLRDAHTPRAAARAIAVALARSLAIQRVELEHVYAELVAGAWQVGDLAGDRTLASLVIVPGLAITGDSLPAYFDDVGFRAALAEVIASAGEHQAVVHRVAELSRRAHAASRELRADLERARPAIVARSAAMRAVLARVELVARHATTVLVTGESGTGKEVVARELHRLSPRARRPFVHVNCGAIPDTLVESELFGHERGAFTGAERTHAGVFERAHGGTLLLDEIGELSPAAQVKLLRVLQERQLRRVGGTADIAVDVRLVGATNRSLRAQVAAGAFREDLLYRLDVFAIAIPPLRERRADIGPLVAAFVDELARRLELPRPPITRRTLARLEAHDWPGNVRELANVIEAALILGDGGTLELPTDFGSRVAGTGGAFADAQRAAIEDALRATRGKLYGSGGAAARLGMPPATLQSKMHRLGIRRAGFVR